jgi:cytoskeletal protein RodZ
MVGYTLRQERERQNLSIEDIEQGTSIRALYIEAIEGGEYDKLPGKVYTKGFIKNYANFLGMDADLVIKEFQTDMAELEAEAQAEEAEQSAEANHDVKTEVKTESKPVKPEKKKFGYSIEDDSAPNKSSVIIVAAVVFIAALAGGAWSWLSNSDGEVAKVNPPVQQTQIVTTEPVAESISESTTESVANANPAPKNDVVNVQARFNDRCWTLVTVDGAVVQEGIIEGGQTLSWEGKDNVTFRLGNAGAVEFFQDGKSVGILGAEGDIVDKTFTRS